MIVSEFLSDLALECERKSGSAFDSGSDSEDEDDEEEDEEEEDKSEDTEDVVSESRSESDSESPLVSPDLLLLMLSIRLRPSPSVSPSPGTFRNVDKNIIGRCARNLVDRVESAVDPESCDFACSLSSPDLPGLA